MTNLDPLTMTFDDNVTEPRTYVAMAPAEPHALYADVASELWKTSNRADYLVITPAEFYDAVMPLALHRATGGLAVMVVPLEDIYDEFNYGVASPYGIKAFLRYTYEQWARPAPLYVLLVGKGSYDHKDNMNDDGSGGMIDYMPTYLTVTEFFGETACDEWFARIAGEDLLADMYVGRLPAATSVEVTAMVNKIIAYESAPSTGTWEQHAIFAAGDGYTSPETAYFQAMNEDVASLVEASGYGFDISKTYDTMLDIQGAVMVNYCGHGSALSWKINGSADRQMDYILSYLNLGDKVPFFVNMTCLNGYFVANYKSLAELLLAKTDGGAIASLSSTGMTFVDVQHVLDYGLYEAFFAADYRTLGSALSYAKTYLLANTDFPRDVANTFLLFGDPAMQLKLPEPVTAPSLESTTSAFSLLQ